MLAALLPLLLVLGCSDDFKDASDEPSPDTDADSDTDTDTDTDADTDTDTDSDTDTDTDTDTDVDPDDVDDDGDGVTENEGDCDDDDDAVSSAEQETPYNGVDDDCDPTTPDDDLDADGYASADDCDDGDASVSPGDPEVAGNGADDDCDGTVDERFDVATVDAGKDCGSSSAVAVDSAGNVHVAYYDADGGTLQYASADTTGAWSLGGAVVDYAGAAGTGYYVDAVIDTADRFQVAYTFASDVVELDFIYRDADGTWSDEFVVHGDAMDGSVATSSSDIGYFVSIDVDEENLPSFAYYDNERYTPILADILTSPWDFLAIDAFYIDVDYNYQYDILGFACDMGLYTSLAVDTDGFDQVAYYDDCTLAEEAQFSKWDLEFDSLVYSETIEDDGLWTSLALTSGDVSCVAFQDAARADLRYGCRNDASSSWSTQAVDSSGSVGAYAQLAFDSTDQPWIAYYDETNGNLKVATYEGSTWSVITVDSAGDVGRAPSLAIGPDDRVHVTYYDATTGALKYAVGG